MQNIIDLGFDPAALEVTKKPIMDSLLEVYNLAQKINDTQIKLGTDNSWQLLATSQKELANTIKSIEKANTDLVASITKANAAAKEDINFTKQSTQANNDNAVSIARKGKASKETPEQRQAYINSVPFTSNLADLQAEAAQAEATGTAVSELDVAQAQAANSATVWGEASAIQAAAEGELTVAVTASTLSLKEKIAMEKAAAIAAKEDAAINEYLSNDYKQLSLAYNEAGLKAKNYALQLGENHPLTLQAAADANTMGETLKRLDSTVGQNQRNVGNYAGSLEGAFSRVTNGVYLMTTAINQGVRMIIRFGVQMLIFQVIFKAFEILGEKVKTVWENMQAPLTEFALTQQILQKVLSDTNTQYAKAVENVDKLTIEVGLAKDGFVDKNAVVKDYNDTMGKTTGLVTTLDQVEQKLVDDGPAYIKMMLDKSVAMLALNEAAEAQLELAKLQDEEKLNNDITPIKDTLTYGQPLQPDIISQKGSANRDDIKKQQDIVDKKLDIVKKYLKDAGEITEEYGFSDETGATEKAHKLLDIDGQLYELLLKKRIDYNQSIYEDDNKSYDDRLEALKREGNLKVELLGAQMKSELKTNQETQDNITTELKTATEKQRANLLIDLQNAQGAEKVIRQKFADEELKQGRDNITAQQKFEAEAWKNFLSAEENYNKAKLDLTAKTELDLSTKETESVDKRVEAYAKYYQAQEQLISNDYNYRIASEKLTSEQLLALQAETNVKRIELLRKAQIETSNIIISAGAQQLEGIDTDNALALSSQKLALYNSLKDKFGGIEEYVKKAKDLDKAANIQKQQDTVDQDKWELLDINLQGDARLKLQEKLKKDQTALNDAQIDTDTTNDKRTKLEKEIEYQQEATTKIVDLVDEQYDHEKQRIEEQMKLIDQQKQQAIDNVQTSTLNAQQKAAAEREIDRQAAIQKQQLQQQEKAADIAKARFDKAAATSNVIENTAVKVTDPKTPTWEVPAIIALGVIELAKIAAQPLPAYALGAGVNGRPLHGGGPALFGEAGLELVQQPGLSPFVAYKPTIMDLAPNTKITPMGNTMNDYLLKRSIEGIDVPNKVDERWLANAIVSGVTGELQNVTRAIKRQKAPVIIDRSRGDFDRYINNAIRN